MSCLKNNLIPNLGLGQTTLLVPIILLGYTLRDTTRKGPMFTENMLRIFFYYITSQ